MLHAAARTPGSEALVWVVEQGADVIDPREIDAYDPHHGARPVGAAAAAQSVSRAKGEEAAAVIAKYVSPDEVRTSCALVPMICNPPLQLHSLPVGASGSSLVLV